jgi:septal ring factor EnvC (AmiA/AmiB activator)
MRARTHRTNDMSYHYDATMTKSRMEMTNLGCALIEEMNATDLNAKISKHETYIAQYEQSIRERRKEIASLRRQLRTTKANKAKYEAAILA